MFNIKRGAAVAALGAGLAVGAAVPAVQASTHHTRTVVLPTRPCPSEDATVSCFWDAGERGNGHGYSFWVLRRGPHRVCVQYLDPAFNRVHGWCGNPSAPAYGGGPLW